MKTVELQLKSHRYLIFLSIVIILVSIIYMMNLFFDNLLKAYQGVMVYLSDYVYEDGWSVIDRITFEVNENLFDYFTLVNDPEFMNKHILFSMIKMYRDASILYGLIWVVVSYVFLYDPMIRGHYKVYMNLAGFSRKRFLTLHTLTALLYVSVLGILTFVGYSIFLFRAGFPYIFLSVHLITAFLLGYLSYFMTGLFLGVASRSIELSLIIILPLILLKPFPPSNPLLILAPDMIYLYILTGEYSNIISIWTIAVSILFYLIIGLIGIYMFLRGRRV